jgi:hypothetical protein
MRAGARPKSYKNGARWVTARGGGRRKATNKEGKSEQVFNPLDIDGDGHVTPTEIKFFIATHVVIYGAAIIFLIWFFGMAYWGIQLQKIK